MRLPGSGRFKQLFRSTGRLFTKRALVLLYHRVASLAPDPQLLCVTPAHFAEHLEVLREYGDPVSLHQLLPSVKTRARGRTSVAVTFDDGYIDNLDNAKPLLERHDIPATVFVTTGYVGTQNEFWYDALERLLLQPGILPDTLRVAIDGTLHEWHFRSSSHYDPKTHPSYAGWNITTTVNPTRRHELYRSVFQRLHPLPDQERRRVVYDLLKAAGMKSSGRATHRILSPDEIVQITTGGLVEVGSHTVTHTVLSTLPLADQTEEIARSKAFLQNILNRRVTTFAYPFGGRAHYSAETVVAVRDAGFESACSNFPGLIHARTDPWQLPRFLVRDCDGEQFARSLHEWING